MDASSHNRTGAGAKKRKIEKSRIKANELWDQQHQRAIELWKAQFHVEEDEVPSPVQQQLDVGTEHGLQFNLNGKQVVPLKSTLTCYTSISQFMDEAATPLEHPTPTTVPCILLDTVDLEQFKLDDHVVPEVITQETEPTPNQDPIIIHTNKFSNSNFNSQTKYFNPESVLIYTHERTKLDAFNHISAIDSTYWPDLRGEKMLLITNDAKYVKAYKYNLFTISVLYPPLLCTQRLGHPLPEGIMHSDLVFMGTKGVSQYVGFVT